MHFVSTGFSDWTEHIFLFWGDLKNSSFSAYSLWEYLVVPKRTENFVFVGVSFYSLEVDGWGVACSSGEAAWDPVGVLPSVSSFFSAFSILLRCVSSLLMAAPRLRSINLAVEMPNFAATSQMVLGLYFSPRHFLRFFSKPCQSIYPIARTLLNNSSLPSSCRSSSAHAGTLVEGRGVCLHRLIDHFWRHLVYHPCQLFVILPLLMFYFRHSCPDFFDLVII